VTSSGGQLDAARVTVLAWRLLPSPERFLFATRRTRTALSCITRTTPGARSLERRKGAGSIRSIYSFPAMRQTGNWCALQLSSLCVERRAAHVSCADSDRIHLAAGRLFLILLMRLSGISFRLRPWRGRSSDMNATAWGRAGPGTWSRRRWNRTGAQRGNWYGTSTAGRSSCRATA
jgi:hypothetical protein